MVKSEPWIVTATRTSKGTVNCRPSLSSRVWAV